MKKYNCNGIVYTEIERHPKFASAFSDKKRRYSLYSIEDGTATDFFLDEVITSSSYKPLRSWTENYIVGRIGENYYIVDSHGNCFHESKKKYVICRNLILCDARTYKVNGEKIEFFNFAINKNLEKIDCSDHSEQDVVEVRGLAMRKHYVRYEVLNASGYASVYRVNLDDYSTKEKLDQNVVFTEYDRVGYVLLDYDFNIAIDNRFTNIHLLSRETLTYMLIYQETKIRYHSIMYGELACWIDGGDFEFILKLGNTEPIIHKKVDCEPQYLKLDIGGAYIYRISNKAIVVQKADGQIIKNDSLSLDNLYLGSLLEKFLKNMEK